MKGSALVAIDIRSASPIGASSLEMKQLEKLIEDELHRFAVPGAAVAVVQDGDVVMCRGFGYRDASRGLAVTEQTLFPIGSTTKGFTSAVVASLVDSGALEWDRPVRHYVPEFELSDPLASRDITLRDMLSHRTGLPRHDMVWMMGGHGAMTRADLVRRLRWLELNKGLRQTWQYNNLMYMAAGYVVEVASGSTWEDAVQDRILDPLGMENTNFFISDLQKSDDRSVPYGDVKGEVAEVPFRGIETVGPAGSINSCIADMTAWLQFSVGGGKYEGRQIVSEASVRELYAPTISMPEGALPWDEIRFMSYALGWIVESYRGERLLWHNGGVDGFKALVSFIPEQRAGIVVLANKFPSLAPEAISYVVFDELLDLEPLPWGERFHEVETAADGSGPSDESSSSPATSKKAPTHPLEDFAGTYEHPGYGRIAFRVVDGQLTAELPGLDTTLTHRHFNVWDALEKIHGISIPFSFASDVDGKIVRVEAVLEDTVAPIVFEKVPAD